MRDRIYITDDDCERLRRLIAGRRGVSRNSIAPRWSNLKPFHAMSSQ